jgi:hypothetical protein
MKKQKITGAKSLVELPRIDKSPISVITTVPLGFFYALLQPTPLQSHGKVIVFVNGVENLLFVLLFVFLLLKIQKQEGERARLFWFLFFIAAVYLSFIGLLVPVLGNMVRYKAVVIPVLMASLLLLQKEQRRTKKLGFSFFKFLHGLNQGLYSAQWHCIVNRRSETAYASMSFQSNQTIFFSILCEERF